jgi:hypothetical protein
MWRWRSCALLMLAALPALGQQTAPKKQNELVVGKLVYVAPMPDGVDQWMIDFLRRWGRYKVTGDPEGVDLVIRPNKAEKDMDLETRGGVAQPRGEGPRSPIPFPKRSHNKSDVISITAVDWVTNQTLWRAEILDRKPKKDEPDAPAGPHTQIFARDLSADQLAQKLTARLRQYVEELEKAGSPKP